MASSMDPTKTPALPPPNGITSNLEHPHNSIRAIWLVACTLGLLFPSILVPLRLYIKLFLMKSLQLVDSESSSVTSPPTSAQMLRIPPVFCILSYVCLSPPVVTEND